MNATAAPPREPAVRPSLRAIARIDLALFRRIRGAAVRDDRIRAVRAFSTLGEHAAIWLAIGAGGSALDRPRRRAWLRATAGIGAAYLVNTAIKQVARRPRPTVEGLPALMRTPTQLSFPSAHSASAFAAARGFSGAGLLPGLPLYATAAAMSASRVYLGVHFPSDVVAGAALGTAIGSLAR